MADTCVDFNQSCNSCNRIWTKQYINQINVENIDFCCVFLKQIKRSKYKLKESDMYIDFSVL